MDAVELQDLQDAASGGLDQVLQSSVVLGGAFLPSGSRLLTDVSHTAVPLTVRLQLVKWSSVPLSAFGQALRAGSHSARPLTVQALAERWRDRMISEGDKVVGEFIDYCPSADVQHLRNLVRNARKEVEKGKNTGQARKLFRALREWIDDAEQ